MGCEKILQNLRMMAAEFCKMEKLCSAQKNARQFSKLRFGP
jgi:hypothetical protein